MRNMNKEIYSVSEINRYVKEIIESSFDGQIVVEGEISQLQKSQLGHVYITLKDEKSSVRCTLWSSRVHKMNVEPEIGLNAIVKCKVSFYEKTGSYQLDILGITSAGAGKFHESFEKLKIKLKKEGLFEAKFKKSLPLYPKNISIVTSLTGSVLQDILKILDRRISGIKIEIYSCNVQGDNCASSIIKQLVIINKKNTSDVIIIARGGGSLEDLIEYNNEFLARQIYNSKIPIITAVGHETDTTIADLVSDKRAATPSEAAEIATSITLEDTINNINTYKNDLQSIVNIYFNNLRHQLRERINIVDKNSPAAKILNYNQKISIYAETLKSKLLSYIILERNKVNDYKIKLKSENPKNKVSNLESNLINKKELLKNLFVNNLNKKRNFLQLKKNTIENVSPLSVLEKGYSVVYSNGKVISRASDFNLKKDIKIKVKDGEIISNVKKITRLDY